MCNRFESRIAWSVGISPRTIVTLVLIIPAALFGQGYFGTVSGEITDPSGAVVPGAKITLVDQQKGYQFATTSDRVGRYLFTSVPPGTYSVSAEMRGLRKRCGPASSWTSARM